MCFKKYVKDLLSSSFHPCTEPSSNCQALTAPSCSHMPYNMTAINKTQDQIEDEMEAVLPLIQAGCSEAMTDLFCSLHAPPCNDQGLPLFPCREMCEAAFEGCTIIQRFYPDLASQCNLYPPKSSGSCFFLERNTGTVPGMVNPWNCSLWYLWQWLWYCAYTTRRVININWCGNILQNTANHCRHF